MSLLEKVEADLEKLKGDVLTFMRNTNESIEGMVGIAKETRKAVESLTATGTSLRKTIEHLWAVVHMLHPDVVKPLEPEE